MAAGMVFVAVAAAFVRALMISLLLHRAIVVATGVMDTHTVLILLAEADVETRMNLQIEKCRTKSRIKQEPIGDQ